MESLNDRLKRQAAEKAAGTKVPVEAEGEGAAGNEGPPQAPPTAETGGRFDPEKKKYFIAIGLLAVLVAFLSYKVSQQSSTIDAQETGIEQLDQERASLEFDLEKMRFSYDTLSVENGLMMAEMAAQRGEIDGLLAKVRDRNYKVSRLKKEAGTLRRIMQGYVVTIDSINQLNIALVEENTAMQEEVSAVKKENEALVQRQDDMEEIIQAGQVLQAMDLMPQAIRIMSNGAQRKTDRAKRAEMIKTCFTLMESRVAKPGARTLTMEVVGPDSTVLSVSRAVDYAGERLEACIFWTAVEPLATGTYTVHLIDQGERISTADLILR
jgi:FtsZ-binding cell division protein ZapB